LTESLQKVNEKLFDHGIFDVNSCDELWDYINPHFKVDFIYSISNYLVNLHVVTMAEPNFHESQRILQNFRRVRRFNLVA
jgi:hypothetical protein